MPKFRKEIYGSAFVNQFIAEMEGQKYHDRPFAFVDDAGSKFSHIAGAIAMPSMAYPGYLITMGVGYNDQKIFGLDEHESNDEIELIEAAQGIQKDYGAGVVSTWYGNPASLMPLVNATQDDDSPILISYPMDHNIEDAFQLYVFQILAAIVGKHKTLTIGKCNTLRNALVSFDKDKTQKIANNPVIYAAGSLVHTLLTLRPWEQAFERIELAPTTIEDMADYAHKKEIEALHRELYGGDAA